MPENIIKEIKKRLTRMNELVGDGARHTLMLFSDGSGIYADTRVEAGFPYVLPDSRFDVDKQNAYDYLGQADKYIAYLEEVNARENPPE